MRHGEGEKQNDGRDDGADEQGIAHDAEIDRPVPQQLEVL